MANSVAVKSQNTTHASTASCLMCFISLVTLVSV